MSEQTALTLREMVRDDGALKNAIALWADATTSLTSLRRHELIHDKREATRSFFAFMGKHPSEVSPLDVSEWRRVLEAAVLQELPLSYYPTQVHPSHPSGITILKQHKSSFKWRHFEPMIILLCVRWYCRYQLSYRDLEVNLPPFSRHRDKTFFEPHAACFNCA